MKINHKHKKDFMILVSVLSVIGVVLTVSLTSCTKNEKEHFDASLNTEELLDFDCQNSKFSDICTEDEDFTQTPQYTNSQYDGQMLSFMSNVLTNNNYLLNYEINNFSSYVKELYNDQSNTFEFFNASLNISIESNADILEDAHIYTIKKLKYLSHISYKLKSTSNNISNYHKQDYLLTAHDIQIDKLGKEDDETSIVWKLLIGNADKNIRIKNIEQNNENIPPLLLEEDLSNITISFFDFQFPQIIFPIFQL